MAEKLIVKNFGPIRDAELDIKKTTVLIGPQGSGKSTIAKLAAIFGDKNAFNRSAFIATLRTFC
ncbi:MAG: AAA family ATPase [Emticicia sp.]|nr:AAA family ATPase [Emticicia sp.]